MCKPRVGGYMSLKKGWVDTSVFKQRGGWIHDECLNKGVGGYMMIV